MTILDICNNALADLGHDAVITSLDPAADPSREASRCALFYPRARAEVLSVHPWSFNTVTEAAVRVEAAESTLLVPGFTFCYAAPTSSLRINDLLSADGQSLSFLRQSGLLHAREEADTLLYTIDAEDPADWPALVQEAVIACLAHKLARPMAKSQRVTAEAAQTYGAALATAKHADNLSTRRETGTPNPFKSARS